MQPLPGRPASAAARDVDVKSSVDDRLNSAAGGGECRCDGRRCPVSHELRCECDPLGDGSSNTMKEVETSTATMHSDDVDQTGDAEDRRFSADTGPIGPQSVNGGGTAAADGAIATGRAAPPARAVPMRTKNKELAARSDYWPPKRDKAKSEDSNDAEDLSDDDDEGQCSDLSLFVLAFPN
jgi:hypothetical protein